jgi:hypothetical protein
MRKTRNPNPNYTGINEEMESNRPLIREMNDIANDVFPKVDLAPTIRPTAARTLYNKFKRVIVEQKRWRVKNLFKKAVSILVKRDWKAATLTKTLFRLQKFRTTFCDGNVTIRPLVNYPSHIGVFATSDIMPNETIFIYLLENYSLLNTHSLEFGRNTTLVRHEFNIIHFNFSPQFNNFVDKTIKFTFSTFPLVGTC